DGRPRQPLRRRAGGGPHRADPRGVAGKPASLGIPRFERGGRGTGAGIVSSETPEKLRPRLYAWGRRTLPVSLRRKIRRAVPIERVFGIRKKPVEGLRGLTLEQDAGSGRAYLFLPVISWFYRWQRPQQLAAALAQRGRVFYASLRATTEPAHAAADPCGV